MCQIHMPDRMSKDMAYIYIYHKEGLKIYQIECQKKAEDIPDTNMPDRMSGRMPEYARMNDR